MSWRIPVLAYHANNILGDDYARNDHVALASDLRSLAVAGWQVVSAHRVAAALRGEAEAPPARSVANEGWCPQVGCSRSCQSNQPPSSNVIATLLRERRETMPGIHATSFVIVSPEARAELDRTCMVGKGWWGDDWWPAATREGLIAIESHSWDHNHDTLPATAMGDAKKGTFANVTTHAQADAEIRRAADWLDARLGTRTTLFAYPYGEPSAYLREEYFPRHAHEHRVRAAFGTVPAPVTPASDRWDVPRYVCGFHWKSPAEFEALLRDAGA
jgi:hypothetical protein